MTIELYTMSGSPFGWRPHLALEVKGIDYECHVLQRSTRDMKKPEYLAMNPRGKVPLLKDGDFIITESMAIVEYLDRKYPEPPLYGRNAEETGRIVECISEFDSYLMPEGLVTVLAVYFDRVTGHEKALRKHMQSLIKELNTLEDKTGDWMVGDAVSAADIASYPFVRSILRAAEKDRAREIGLDQVLPFDKKYPKLAAWCARIEAMPGYDNTYPPHWRD